MPVYNKRSHIVYSAKTADVDTVIMNGKIVMKDREIKTVNVDRVMMLVEETRDSLLERADAGL